MTTLFNKPSKLALLAALVLLGGTPAGAADAPQTNDPAFTSAVLELNKVNPAQNPQYRLVSRVTDFRLLDQNRRTLGKVTDVTFDQNGQMIAVEADVTATGFQQTLSFDVAAYNVTPESDAFTVALTRDQVQDSLPSLLGGIETAAGEGDGEPITAKSLIGASVKTTKGDTVGRVNNVLIDERRKVAVALLLTLASGSGQSTVAIPYQAPKIERHNVRASVEITEDQAKIATAYAKR